MHSSAARLHSHGHNSMQGAQPREAQAKPGRELLAQLLRQAQGISISLPYQLATPLKNYLASGCCSCHGAGQGRQIDMFPVDFCMPPH